MSNTRQRHPEPYELIVRSRQDIPVQPLYGPRVVPAQRAQTGRGNDIHDTQRLSAVRAAPSAAHRPAKVSKPGHGQPTVRATDEPDDLLPSGAARGGQDEGAGRDGADPLEPPFHPHSLAQQAFLVNFTDSMYRPALHGCSLELGLAAAQLCDLVLEHTIEVRDGRIRLTPHCPAAETAAPVAVQALHYDRSSRPPEHRGTGAAVGDWIDILAPDACEHVAAPLLAAGVLRRTSPQWWRRTALRFEVTPAGQVATATPRGQLRSAAANQALSLNDVALFAVLRVLDLDRTITSEAPQHVTDRLHAAVATLARPVPDARSSGRGGFRPPTPADRARTGVRDILAALAVHLQREALRR